MNSMQARKHLDLLHSVRVAHKWNLVAGNPVRPARKVIRLESHRAWLTDADVNYPVLGFPLCYFDYRRFGFRYHQPGVREFLRMSRVFWGPTGFHDVRGADRMVCWVS